VHVLGEIQSEPSEIQNQGLRKGIGRLQIKLPRGPSYRTCPEQKTRFAIWACTLANYNMKIDFAFLLVPFLGGKPLKQKAERRAFDLFKEAPPPICLGAYVYTLSVIYSGPTVKAE
jgi:hypothetical protein